jgi:serine/threonine protein kinase
MPSFRYQYGDRPLEGFTIQHGVGRGGFGEVYFAISDTGREVALKSVQQYEDIELRGIGHCMNLKSPHLISIFDIRHSVNREPFVVMEYVNGPSLRDILDEAPHGLGTVKAVYLLREVAKGLSFLHQNGVVHRDLKPHNVFIDQGLVKIGDYSLSKIMTTSHRSGHTVTVGTVHYMAPEIGLGRYDHTVDITLWELCFTRCLPAYHRFAVTVWVKSS